MVWRGGAAVALSVLGRFSILPCPEFLEAIKWAIEAGQEAR